MIIRIVRTSGTGADTSTGISGRPSGDGAQTAAASSHSDHGAWLAKNRSIARDRPTVRRDGPAISGSAMPAWSRTTNAQHSVVLSSRRGVTCAVAPIAIAAPITSAASAGRLIAVSGPPRLRIRASLA